MLEAYFEQIKDYTAAITEKYDRGEISLETYVFLTDKLSEWMDEAVQNSERSGHQ